MRNSDGVPTSRIGLNRWAGVVDSAYSIRSCIVRTTRAQHDQASTLGNRYCPHTCACVYCIVLYSSATRQKPNPHELRRCLCSLASSRRLVYMYKYTLIQLRESSHNSLVGYYACSPTSTPVVRKAEGSFAEQCGTKLPSSQRCT